MAVKTDIYGDTAVQYEGCVLGTYELNGYHDSDFYAVVWDEETQSVKEVEYDTTRCGGSGSAKVDATEKVLKKVYRYYFNMSRRDFDNYSNKKQAKTIFKGDTVKVIRGRKVPKGTMGIVFWIGETYNNYRRLYEKRVGVEIEKNKVFLPIEYLEVVDWESRLITGKKRKELIRQATIKKMPRWCY